MRLLCLTRVKSSTYSNAIKDLKRDTPSSTTNIANHPPLSLKYNVRSEVIVQPFLGSSNDQYVHQVSPLSLAWEPRAETMAVANLLETIATALEFTPAHPGSWSPLYYMTIYTSNHRSGGWTVGWLFFCFFFLLSRLFSLHTALIILIESPGFIV